MKNANSLILQTPEPGTTATGCKILGSLLGVWMAVK
jgi:hypothetical protein